MIDSPLLGFGTPDANTALEPLNNSSIAYATGLVVKTGPGILYGFTVYNSNASAQFILIFDARAIPADGAVPACVFTVAGSSNLPVQYLPGRTFLNGCVLVNSSTGPTKTVGSADCWFDAQFL
jgi:hypothetical protein